MFKKHLIKFLIAMLFLASIAFIVFKVYFPKKNKAPAQNIENISAPVDLSKIVPGITKKEEVVNKLGKPIKNDLINNSEVLFYASESKTRNSQVVIENGTVTLIKEMVLYTGSQKVSDITKIYGVAIYSFSSPGLEGDNKLYVYPDKGIAYLGNPKFNVMEEVWYFTPTTIEKFKEKWVPNYSEKGSSNLY